MPITYTLTAKLVCACGATAELDATASVDSSSSGWSGCACCIEYDCDYWSLGWRSGELGDSLECPACKEVTLNAKYPQKVT